MSVRRLQVLDAAVQMLALGGDRAMTYRIVDTAAGVPSGTASNHFRTREALLLAVATRVERQRRHVWEQLLCEYEPSSTGQLARMLTAYLTDAASDDDHIGILARAHMALLPLSASYPEVAKLLAESRRHHIFALRRPLAVINPAAPPGLAAVIIDYLTGTLADHHPTAETGIKISTTGLAALTALLAALPDRDRGQVDTV